MRLKGPELKKPELKAPRFLVDLYWDLRDRHLLPLIGLVVVAIVAAPFLLGDNSEEPSLSEVQEMVAEAATAEVSGAGSARLSVVEAKPGLRDYRKRLRDRTPTDPFRQRFTAPQVGEADLPESTAESSSADGGETKKTTTAKAETKEGSVTVTETETSEGEGSEGDSSAPADAGGDLRFRSISIDVRIVRTTGSSTDGTKKKGKPTVKRSVLASTPLPGPKAQVATFMGLSPKTFKPTFLVSTEVTAMFGEAQCASGTEVCQLVELEQGIPQTFVFGDAGDRYKVEVTDIDLTTVRPPR
jgi:hypothetical protein